MIIPNDEECCRIVQELEDDPGDFIDSNRGRLVFTGKQKEIFARLKEKFDV